MDSTIQIPDPLKVLLLVAIIMIVTEILKKISAALGRDLSGYTAQVTSAIVAAILVLLDAALSHIPAELVPVGNSILSLIVVIIGSWGAYKFTKQVIK